MLHVANQRKNRSRFVVGTLSCGVPVRALKVVESHLLIVLYVINQLAQANQDGVLPLLLRYPRHSLIPSTAPQAAAAVHNIIERLLEEQQL